MIKTVLFDLDGTIIQSTEVILETYELMLKTYFKDIDIKTVDLTKFLGHPLRDSFLEHTTDESLIEEVISAYKKETKKRLEIELLTYPKAKELIQWLKNKKINVGIVTSKSRQVAFENLEKVGLKHLIDCFVGYEDVDNHKPSPEGILKAIDILDIKKSETVYIGDHENDIKAAKSAGVLSCAVSYSLRFETLIKENPDFVIDELMHVKDMI